MNHRQRMESCLSGQMPDRPPVALWRHFPVDDQEPTTLAESVLQFQNQFDWDFIKVTPASSFCVRDYGGLDAWRGNPEGTRDYLSYPIIEAGQWETLKPLDPNQGFLKNQLVCLQKIRQEAPVDVPILQTIFDPMSQAKNLVGRQELLIHMRQHPEQLRRGLDVLYQNTRNFIDRCVEVGIDGIFLAVQHAQSSLLSLAEFREFVLPYDLKLLEGSKSLWINLVHIHGNSIYFEEVKDYPASILNWHDQETVPSLSEAHKISKAVVCGGLRQWDTLVNGNPASVNLEAQNAIAETGGQRFILGTGCVLPITRAPREYPRSSSSC